MYSKCMYVCVVRCTCMRHRWVHGVFWCIDSAEHMLILFVNIVLYVVTAVCVCILLCVQCVFGSVVYAVPPSINECHTCAVCTTSMAVRRPLVSWINGELTDVWS